MLVGLLYKMCKLQLVIPAKTEGALNLVDMDGAENRRSDAKMILRKNPRKRKPRPKSKRKSVEIPVIGGWSLVLSAFCKFFCKIRQYFSNNSELCMCKARKMRKNGRKRMPGLILHGGCDTIIIDVAVCPPLMNGKNL